MRLEQSWSQRAGAGNFVLVVDVPKSIPSLLIVTGQFELQELSLNLGLHLRLAISFHLDVFGRLNCFVLNFLDKSRDRAQGTVCIEAFVLLIHEDLVTILSDDTRQIPSGGSSMSTMTTAATHDDELTQNGDMIRVIHKIVARFAIEM